MSIYGYGCSTVRGDGIVAPRTLVMGKLNVSVVVTSSPAPERGISAVMHDTEMYTKAAEFFLEYCCL